MLSHRLGHLLQGENDAKTDLMQRAIQHMKATADFNIWYGEGRDTYDVAGRTAHECIFNVKDGNFRAPNAQQGFSGFTTWTRGLAWAMLGFAEELEFLATEPSAKKHLPWMEKAAKATCDFYIANTPTDGVPYWDTGAPRLAHFEGYLDQPSDPFNPFEPVDSSAAAIAAQGLIRLGRYLGEGKYFQAGLTVLHTLLQPPYLSTDKEHQGLLLHSIYHQPNGWDYTPPGSKIPYGESCMWGDYHIRELALTVQRLITNEPYYTFYNCVL